MVEFNVTYTCTLYTSEESIVSVNRVIYMYTVHCNVYCAHRCTIHFTCTDMYTIHVHVQLYNTVFELYMYIMYTQCVNSGWSIAIPRPTIGNYKRHI